MKNDDDDMIGYQILFQFGCDWHVYFPPLVNF